MAWTVVVRLDKETASGTEGFWSAVEVWLKRPHVVNRRLVGAVVVQDSRVGGEDRLWKQLREQLSLEGISRDSSLEVGASCGENRVLVRELLPRTQSLPPSKEVVFIDMESLSASFYPLINTKSVGEHSCQSCGGFYKFQYLPAVESVSPKITLSVFSSEPSLQTTASPCPSNNSLEYFANGITAPTVDWLESVLLPKIVQWAEETATRTLRTVPLVPLDRYSKLYHELKGKYGPPLIKNWPEATNPLKYVYEDIGIATYLLILWEEERAALDLKEKQSFVDLGCGNGLLVYLLSSEGHPGKGIDLRERKIWKLYGSKAQLEVSVLTPSDETLFPESDWLIGNHSDELTPWIPVMAARSTYHTRYFVLPCCSHDFDSKFSRPDAHKSQYRSYLDYVKLIGETMGFTVQEDTLRIPSSRRVCQIGGKRSYPPKDERLIDLRRREFLNERCISRKKKMPTEMMTAEGTEPGHLPTQMTLPTEVPDVELQCGLKESGDMLQCSQRGDKDGMSHFSITHSTTAWAAEFKPRPANEHVRNCSRVDHGVKSHIVSTLTGVLLDTQNWIEIDAEDDGGQTTSKRLWNHGGRIQLNDAAKLFDAGILKQLKLEFGGLQTLLRNHHQIFQVTGGYIQLRNWSERTHQSRKSQKPRSQRDAKILVKTKLCWFHENHPQGCPRSHGGCPYAHGQRELRERPDFRLSEEATLTSVC